MFDERDTTTDYDTAAYGGRRPLTKSSNWTECCPGDQGCSRKPWSMVRWPRGAARG